MFNTPGTYVLQSFIPGFEGIIHQDGIAAFKATDVNASA
jgi:hypothetical protein